MLVAIYLAIGGFLVSWFVIASNEMHKEIPRIFRKNNLEDSVERGVCGFIVALAFVLVWLPFLIGAIILKIYYHYH